jgi:Ca2+/Na+ antiporter
MKFSIRLSFALAAFLAVAGIVLTIMGGAAARQGSVLLLTCAVAALYIGLTLRHYEKRSAHDAEAEGAEGELEEAEVRGTIWPFVISFAFVFVVIGAVGARWVLIIGAVVLVAGGVGWFNDIQKQRLPQGHGAGAAADALKGADGG